MTLLTRAAVLVILTSPLAVFADVELTGADRPNIPELDHLRCFDSPYALIYCEDAETASRLSREAAAAVQRFYHYMGVLPKKGAIVADPTGVVSSIDALLEFGADWILPWYSENALKASEHNALDLEQNIRTQIENQLKNMPKAAIEQAVQQALAQAKQQTGLDEGDTELSSVLRAAEPLGHELAHIWFLRAMTPHTSMVDILSKEGGSHYGGPGPDWIDETVAILVENEMLITQRRKGFSQDVLHDRVKHLREFFDMAHPSFEVPEIQDVLKSIEREQAARKDMNRKEPTSSSRVVILSDVENSKAVIDMSAYYNQARCFADYLIEKTERQRIFANIAASILDGQTIDQWLLNNAAKYNLASTVDELNADWMKWAKSRYGNASTKLKTGE